MSNCTYCGATAETVDHVPPVSVAATLGWPLFAVPACRECNALLGARLLLSIPERREYVRKRLRERYAPLLTIPAWSTHELRELGPNLRRDIEAAVRAAMALRLRLDWDGPVEALPVKQSASALARRRRKRR